MSGTHVILGYIDRLKGMAAPIDGLGLLADMHRDIGRDMAEQVFALICAGAETTAGYVDAVYDRAAEVMLCDLHGLYAEIGLSTPACLEEAKQSMAKGFNDRIEELFAAGVLGRTMQ